MTIGVSIVQFVIKVTTLVQRIVTIYKVEAYQVPIVNPRWPEKIQNGLVFLTLQHKTAVISRASQRSPCYIYERFYIKCHISDERKFDVLSKKLQNLKMVNLSEIGRFLNLEPP